ncbi:hypothetical protein [Nocardia rhizosphaerae]|uniref:Uncharacterized protein n=1 Tax=Nocardia rhizosphaerae TaxID=1691571 RepID=A0ABV8LE82_9NOCA
MSSSECRIEFTETNTPGGETIVFGVCDPCGLPIQAASRGDAETRFDHHRTIPAPPAEVLARPATPDDVDDYPEWFLNGRGYPVAVAAKCVHGLALVSFCSGCA